jgi:hypothetical protein
VRAQWRAEAVARGLSSSLWVPPLHGYRHPYRGAQDFRLVQPMYFTDRHIAEDGAVLSMRDELARIWPADLTDGAVTDEAPPGPQILFSTRAWSVLRSILHFLALVLNLAGIFLSLPLGRLRLVLCFLGHTHDRLLFIA